MARALAVRAVAEDAEDAEAHLALALAERALRELAGALAAFDRARALDPELFEAHAGAGALRLQLRDFTGAASAFEAAIRARPRDYAARIGLALGLRGAIDRGDDAAWVARYEAAERAIQAAIVLAPDRPEAHLSLGILLLRHGPRTTKGGGALLEARRSFERFLRIAGASPGLARERQIAEQRLQEIRDATECAFDVPGEVRRERAREAWVKQAEDELKIE